MRIKMKKIITYIITAALAVGTIGIMPNINIQAQEFDGDVVINPWEDLFKDDEDSSNKDIPLPSDGTTKEQTTTAGGTQSANSDAVKKLKAQLNIKVISATKKSKKAKTAKIVLKKRKKAVSYQIRYSTSKKFKKYKTKTFKKNKITLKALKAGKKYYVKARAVGKLNGSKVYGKWTKRKTIKVQKKANK